MIVRIDHVYIPDSTHVMVQWSLESVSEQGEYSFVVERSGSPSEWESVSGILRDTYYYEDDLAGINVYSLDRDLYYRIRAVPPSGEDNEVYSDSVDLRGTPRPAITDSEPVVGLTVVQDGPTGSVSTPFLPRPKDGRRRVLVGRAIQRQAMIYFKHLDGQELLLLKRRHYGWRCTDCFDPLTKTIVRSNCTTCYGTSWQGGYYAPYTLWGKVFRQPPRTIRTNTGKETAAGGGLIIMGFPRITEGDLLVDPFNNERWLLEPGSDSRIRGIPYLQYPKASAVARSDIEFDIPTTR